MNYLISKLFFINSGDKNKSLQIEIDCPEDKDDRKKIHDSIRNNLSLFDSKTVIEITSREKFLLYYLVRKRK